MTRVLLIHQPTDGGVGRHVSDLAVGLHERGHTAILCGPSPPLLYTGPAGHVPLDLRRAIAARADAHATMKLMQIVAQVQPDVIHAHSSKAGAVARLARVAHPRLPVIYTPHGYAFAGHFDTPRQRRAYQWIERTLSAATSRVVCVCQDEARLAGSVIGARRVRVVHNGIEPAGDGSTDARVLDAARRGPVVGVVSRLQPGKGISTLIEATALLSQRHPRAQVVIAGAGSEADALHELAQRRGIDDRVSFLGDVPDSLSVMRGLDVSVLPSWAEAFPYVMLEAMALGRPVVATNVGGVGEAVVDGESGLLVPPRDAGALAAALAEMLDDPVRAARLGRAAANAVRDRFTRAAMVDGLLGVYDEF